MRIPIFRLKCSSKSKRKFQVVETPTFFPMRHFCLAFPTKCLLNYPYFTKTIPVLKNFWLCTCIIIIIILVIYFMLATNKYIAVFMYLCQKQKIQKINAN